jgi:acetyl-CoA acetyltransferase
MTDDPVVIVGGARTPVGRFGGALKDVEAGWCPP